ncbi:phospholipase D-like domain-containing protein [Saliphagus infecundisoli]|uniref:Phospholipase D-like domain-containing protein n=1 Tax=Saliphagus infecundisoli TaxID=1849069 RepID=A0ABD5Q9G8_9EURY|nr:phospholipase D-like domain-containing protein [Saliphagus infecundisoli]
MRAGPAVAVFVLLAVSVVAVSGVFAIGPGAATVDPAAEPADRCPTGPTEETRERVDELNASDGPRIAGLYPDPTTDGNVGKFLVLSVPDPSVLADHEWTITDGHTTATLPNETDAGRIALSMDPDRAGAMTDRPVAGLEGHLQLSADGDELALQRDGELVDRVAYEDATEGEFWYRAEGEGGEWWPRGATCRPVETAADGEATTFVLPDASDLLLDVLADADDRILLAGYTFTDEDVAEELHAAMDRGVSVSVLIEGGPVDGVPEPAEPLLADLADAGATVRVVGGEGDRYASHHPKYAVVDDRALVTTENWKPAGIGGAGSRGWGVVAEDPAIAADLATVFRADAAGRDTSTWADYRENATFVESDPPSDPIGGDRAPETHAVEETELLLAPDNAEGRLVKLIDSAEEELLVTCSHD